MQHSDIITLSIRDLLLHPKNPRKITQANLNRLCDSIRQNGYWEHRPDPHRAIHQQEVVECYLVARLNTECLALDWELGKESGVVHTADCLINVSINSDLFG